MPPPGCAIPRRVRLSGSAERSRRRAPPQWLLRAASCELHVAADRDLDLGPAMAEDVERRSADHRAVVRAQPRARHAQRMSDAARDLFPKRQVRGDAAPEEP